MLKTTASSIGSIFMMIFFCLLLSQCMTQLKIPHMLVDIFLGFTDNKFVVLLMVNVFLLFVGMIVNDTTAIMLCAPLLTIPRPSAVRTTGLCTATARCSTTSDRIA